VKMMPFDNMLSGPLPGSLRKCIKIQDLEISFKGFTCSILELWLARGDGLISSSGVLSISMNDSLL